MSGGDRREPGVYARPPATMPAQPVSFTIDRLSFEGLSLTGGEAARAGVALERELSRLAAATDWPATGAAVPATRAQAVTVSPGSAPEQIGRAVARALIDAARSAR